MKRISRPSRPFLFIVAYLVGIPVLLSISGSESLPPRAKSIVTGVALLFIYGGVAAVFLGSFLAPFVIFWKAARASDAELQAAAGPRPSPLIIGPAAGPLAPSGPPPRPPIRFFLTSPAWLLSGLGLVGGAGLPPALFYGREGLSLAFGSMLFVGIVGWFIRANASGRPEVNKA